MQLSPGDKRAATFVRQDTGARVQEKQKGARVKEQGSRDKGPGARVKGQGSRSKRLEGISRISDKYIE